MVYQRKILLTGLFLSGLIGVTEVVRAVPRIDVSATIGFKTPTKLDLALPEAQRRGINVESIRIEQKERVEEFYIGDKDQSTVAIITNDYWKSYGITLQDLLYEPEGPDLKKEDSKLIASYTTQRRRLEQERKQFLTKIQGCWKTSTCPDVAITEMQVVGNVEKICQLRQLPIVDVVNVITFEAGRLWFSDCRRKILLPPRSG